MTTRLVSFLGLGPIRGTPPYYTPVAYGWGGRRSSTTPLVQRAIDELLGPADEVVVLGTKRVGERWFDSRLHAELFGRDVDFVTIPDGRDEAELRHVFRVVIGALGLDAELDPRPRPDRVLFDVTHGFRIQPILGATALAFAQSEWLRTGVAAPEVTVLYGAHDVGDGDDARPLWDLTEILSVARYNAALDALVRYGRADDLEALARRGAKEAVSTARAGGAAGPALREHAHLGKLGEAARGFADDLALGRALDLFTKSAPRLRRTLEDDATSAWTDRLPVLAGAVESLRASVAGLCADGVGGPSGVAAMANLAAHGGRTQRFAEQAAAVREGVVTLAAHVLGHAPLPEPGTNGAHAARLAVEQEFTRLLRRGRSGDTEAGPELSSSLTELLALASAIHPVRNDLMHLGLNDGPASAHALRARLAEHTARFAELVSAHSPLVNLSNHSVASWPAPQRAAVGEMGFDGPVDLEGGVPLVDPELDAEAVVALAHGVADRAVRQGAVAAYVASDFVFAFALVNVLQSRGVRCFAAATRRESVEEAQPDGSVKRELRFIFLRFREYPRIE